MLAEFNNHKVMSIDETKRSQIVNAAMKEFTKGFKQASTDIIATESNISKGTLFNYFGTKKDLLRFIFYYGTHAFMEEFLQHLDFEEPDYLKRLKKMMHVKMELSYKYPTLFDFIGNSFNATEDEFQELWEEGDHLRQEWWSINSAAFQGVDFSLFKEELDPEKIMKVIQLTLTGYAETNMRKYGTVSQYQQHFGELVKDVEAYMDFFRTVFYKD